jgi:glycopeptide antibiotics resistance protein
MKPFLPWVIAAALYVVLLIPLLLTPFPRLHAHPRAYLLEFRGAPARALAWDMALNVAVFFPLGWLLAQAACRASTPGARAVVIVMAIAAVFSLAVETIQYFIATRYSSILDVFANTVGAALGALATGRRRRPKRMP